MCVIEVGQVPYFPTQRPEEFELRLHRWPGRALILAAFVVGVSGLLLIAAGCIACLHAGPSAFHSHFSLQQLVDKNKLGFGLDRQRRWLITAQGSHPEFVH